jgi:hypothetical protein
MEPGATLQSAATAAMFAFEQEIAPEPPRRRLNKLETDEKKGCAAK